MAQEIADSTLLDTWASSGLIVEPDISKIIEGWQLGEQPPHEYMNWLQNTFGSKLNHILKNGIAEWNNETEYLAGSSVQHSGNVWICETTNTNSEPTDLNANWEKVAINKDLTVTVDTLADLKNISYPANTVFVSGYHAKNDGAFGSHIFRLKGVKTTETDNGGTVIIATIGGVDYVYELQYDGAVNAEYFGAVGDGITDDTVALQSAFNMNNTELKNKTYVSSSLLSLPLQLISNRATIIGADCQWKEIKKVSFQGKITFDNLIIDSVWESNFTGQIFADTVTIKSTNASWGTFWNKFDFIQTTGIFEINVDGAQSVNQNTFQNVKCGGGLRIYGVNTSGAREAHNNIFVNLDTTGANITSLNGTTGCHIVNDSNLNQCNQIQNWYAESSGNRLILGNWNVLGSNVDANTNNLLIGRNNHYLFSGGTSRNGDFFAGTPINCAKGGSWDILSNNGRPIDVSVTGGVSVSLVTTTDSPDGNPTAMQCTATGTFQAITIPYVLSKNPSVSFTAYVKIENLATSTVELYRGGGNVSTGRTLTSLGNDWYLLRASGDGGFLGDGVSSSSGYIRIYITTSSLPSPAPILTLGSFFLSNEQTGFLPRYIYGRKTAYGTSAPTVGTWSAGDIVYHTLPTAGGFIGWICTVAGTPGTWKTFGAISA